MFEHNSAAGCSPRITFGQSTLRGPGTRFSPGSGFRNAVGRDILSRETVKFQRRSFFPSSCKKGWLHSFLLLSKTRVFPPRPPVRPSVLLVHSSYRFFFLPSLFPFPPSLASISISIPPPLSLVPLLSQKSILSFPLPSLRRTRERERGCERGCGGSISSEKIARARERERERRREPSSLAEREKAPFFFLASSIRSFSLVSLDPRLSRSVRRYLSGSLHFSPYRSALGRAYRRVSIKDFPMFEQGTIWSI